MNAPPPSRNRLPDRRQTFRIERTWKGTGTDIRIFVDIGLTPAGDVGEVFLTSGTGKSGSMLALVSHDLGLALSLLLQSGAAHDLEALETRFASGSLAAWALGEVKLYLGELKAEGYAR